MRFIALILVLIAPSLATASEKIYEDLLYDIRAFHCNVEEEKSPYIFIFTDGGWTLPLYEMLDPKGESTVYDINEKSDDKFSATITTDGNVIQIYFNLKDDKWTRTIVVDGEATEHDCKDVRSTVALIAASILPIIEKDIYVTLEAKDITIEVLSLLFLKCIIIILVYCQSRGQHAKLGASPTLSFGQRRMMKL